MDRSESPTRTYSNCFNSKPSHAIERLQIFLQNKPHESFDQSPLDHSVNDTVKYPSSSTNHDNTHRSSSSYSSKNKSDTVVQNKNNNQTLTYSDAEKLLTMVQRLRHE